MLVTVPPPPLTGPVLQKSGIDLAPSHHTPHGALTSCQGNLRARDDDGCSTIVLRRCNDKHSFRNAVARGAADDSDLCGDARWRRMAVAALQALVERECAGAVRRVHYGRDSGSEGAGAITPECPCRRWRADRDGAGAPRIAGGPPAGV